MFQVIQSTTVLQNLKRHGLTDGETHKPNICYCEHQLQGTGAVFLQSIGLLLCNNCKGWQQIRKPVK